MATLADSACSIPPPVSAASGGEGGERSEPGGGNLRDTGAPSAIKSKMPPTPYPSPPFAARMGGGELRDVCAQPILRAAGKAISTSVPALTALLIAKEARLASASALVSGKPSPVPPEPHRVEVAS